MREKTFFGGRAKLMPWKAHADERGSLLPFAFDELPFTPVRAFVVKGVPTGTVRGRHAHLSGRQWLICVSGAIRMLMRSPSERIELTLDADDVALMIGPGIWCQQTYLTSDAVLLAFASDPYDPSSYVCDPF